MEGSPKSKRVSWASDINLSQVKFYFTVESPSRIGLSGEYDLQVQTLWDQQSVETGIDLNLPPKIDESHSIISLIKNKVSQIPLIIKWSCPPKIMLERIWQVGSGEESLEVEEQYQRESGIPETMYFPGSIVPSNPSMFMDVDNEDNQNSPFEIPMNLIEDEELDHMDSTNLIDFATAACKVLASSIVPSGDEDSNMDPDELFKTLTNPIIVGNLIKLNEATSTSLVVQTNPSQKRMGEPLTYNVRPLSKRKDDYNDYKTSVEKHGGERRDDNGGERRYDNGAEKYGGGERRDDNGGERKYDNGAEKYGGGERRYDNGGERRRYGNGVEKHGGERRRRRRRNDNGGERRRNDNGGERRRYDNGGGRYGGSRRESSSSSSNNNNDYRRRGTKSCSFFNTLEGCRNGDKCNFKHDS